MKMSVKAVFLTSAMGLLTSAMGYAETTASDVLNDLHSANQMEVSMGKMAQEKGATADARAYGETLVKDHEESDKRVVQLAAKKGITLESGAPGILDKIEMTNIKGAPGTDFDKTFAKHMIDDHQKDIAKMQSVQKEPLPEDVRQLVADTLPILQKHLALAQKLYGQPT